LLVAIRLMI
jgi:hypothetical protein